MTADSPTTSLRIRKQGTGNNNNTWGDLEDTARDLIDDAIAGTTSITVTGDYTLSSSNYVADESRRAFLKLAGSPTLSFSVTIPDVSKGYWIWNATAKVASFKNSSGTGATTDAGDIEPIWSDGVNIKQITYGGLRLKDYISASVLAATGALPATTGNNGKLLACVAGSWTPTLIDPTYLNAFSATAAIVRTGTSTTAALTPGDVYNALAEVTLTDAATIALDMSTFINGVVTLGGNRTLGNPTNPKVGQTGRIRVVQDGTGSRTLAYGANWKRPGGAPTLTTTAAATDFIYYEVITSSYILYDIKKNPA
jgi:hypothetical protein